MPTTRPGFVPDNRYALGRFDERVLQAHPRCESENRNVQKMEAHSHAAEAEGRSLFVATRLQATDPGRPAGGERRTGVKRRKENNVRRSPGKESGALGVPSVFYHSTSWLAIIFCSHLVSSLVSIAVSGLVAVLLQI